MISSPNPDSSIKVFLGLTGSPSNHSVFRAIFSSSFSVWIESITYVI